MTRWEAERLWHTYVILTDLEAVFRSFKSELGLRPIYHQKPERCAGYLFITVLAYQFVQIIRRHLRAQNLTASWRSLRETLAGQCRITATFRRENGRTLHARKATQAEPAQQAISRAGAESRTRRRPQADSITQKIQKCSARRKNLNHKRLFTEMVFYRVVKMD